MTTTPRTWIAALAVAAAIGAAPRARADGTNEVRAVTFDENNGITRVHVRGAQTPTFTVYKLERPTRVVVDLPRAHLAESLRGHESAAVLTPSTWAVSTIAAQQLDGDAVRVIVTLARPGRYDVKTVGDELVVMVMPRDPAPKTANPEELARAQAESAQARQQAAQSKAEAEAAKAAAAQAQQEAMRLRQAAADQAARAQAAQRAADDARRAQQQAAANADDLARAKAITAKAQADAERARAQAAQASEAAAKAQADADRLRASADDEKRAAETMATQARDAMSRAQAMQAQAKDELARAQATSQQAHDEMTRAQAAQQQAHDEMTRAQAEAETARQEAERAKRDAEAKSAEAEAARREAAQQTAQNRADAAQAKQALARAQADAEAARQEAERAKHEAEAKSAEAEAARRDADAKRGEVESAKREMAALSEQSRGEVDAAKAEAAQARAEAEREKAEAARARREAEKMMKDARVQLAAIERKAADAQQLEDRARAANAAAQAREEAARDEAARVAHERELAEAAAKRAQDARASADTADRAKLDAQARDAEARLAAANQATADAEARRMAAEKAAEAARQQLEQTRTALASVEQQRAATEASATEAARKRSEAEAAVKDAVRRRAEAEQAAAAASRQRGEAEHAATVAEAARVAAEHQRELAEAARAAAERQRKIAEASARSALAAQHQAEASLAELTARRDAAERAAAEVEARTRAEAKAQAEVAAARARQASDADIAAARAEVKRLAAERRRAEDELADRRKAVAAQQAEAARLQTAAAQAKDAADREEARRATLVAQRQAEEQQLAQLKQQESGVRHPAPGVRYPASAPSSGVAPDHSPVTLASAPVPTASDRTPDAGSRKPALARVQSINFRGGEDNGQVDLAITGNPDVHLGEVTAEHVELIVDHAELAPKLERTLDVSRFGSPIRRVSSFRDRRVPGRVRLIAELSQLATSTIDRDANGVRWRFSATEHAEPATADASPPVIGGFAASTPITGESVSQVPPPSFPRRRIYHGATVDFDFKDAPIHDLLRIIAETGHVNIVVPDTIDAKVTVKLTHVPWDEALEVILASHGLWYRREGNLYRIAPRKELDAEDEAEAARRAAAVKAEAPKPEVVTLNYASADELKPKLEGMLSPKGHLEVDGRTNALIINDVAGNREQIARLALQLDTQTPQITIEARIVEARSTFVREIGIQWGGNALAGASGGNATGLVFPSSIGIVGGNEDAQTKRTGVSLPSDFAVNIPAATGSGEGGALGISLGSVAGNLNINLRLSALEDAGTVRIISAPKITVLNNKQAEIRQGVSIPISVVSAAGTQTQFVQADLKLAVTPYVSQRDCAIAMNLEVTKNEPDFVNVGARGDPTILRKEAKTTMLVADGETTVLGGIYTRNSGLAYKKVPFFGDLPFIGWLFKNRRENDDRTEILVFITPKITNKALLRCAQ